jgi:hypothetical protein
MPTVVLLSTQIDGDIVIRYTQARWLLLTGTKDGSPTESTHAFCRDILGYDLAGFLERNSTRFKAKLEKALIARLKPDGN